MLALKLVTVEDLCDESIQRLMAWRIKNRLAYKGTYLITMDSIRNWLQEYVLNNPNRVLYWIWVDGTIIGHIGLTNIKIDRAEVCDVSRGTTDHPGAMGAALELLIAPYKLTTLRVLTDNTHSIKFYEHHGYIRTKVDGDGYFHYEKSNRL